jgi:hypothetical protein
VRVGWPCVHTQKVWQVVTLEKRNKEINFVFPRVRLASCDRSVDELQQLVLEQGRRSQATLASGRRPILAPRGGRPSVGRAAAWRWRACCGGGRSSEGGGARWLLMGEVVPRCGAGVSSRSSSWRVCLKKSWACKLARRVGVESVSRYFDQVLVSVRICCSWSVSCSRSCPGARIGGREDKWWGGHLRVLARRSSLANSGTMTG